MWYGYQELHRTGLGGGGDCPCGTGIKNCIGQGWGGGDCPCGMGIKNCIGQGWGGLSLWYGYQELHRTGLGGGLSLWYGYQELHRTGLGGGGG